MLDVIKLFGFIIMNCVIISLATIVIFWIVDIYKRNPKQYQLYKRLLYLLDNADWHIRSGGLVTKRTYIENIDNLVGEVIENELVLGQFYFWHNNEQYNMHEILTPSQRCDYTARYIDKFAQVHTKTRLKKSLSLLDATRSGVGHIGK